MYKNMVEVPEELEHQINDLAEQVASKMFYRPDQTAKIEFEDVHYDIKMMRTIMNFKRVILLVAADRDNGKVIKAVGECDNSFSDYENYKATVTAFLRDRAGMDLRPSVTEEE